MTKQQKRDKYAGVWKDSMERQFAVWRRVFDIHGNWTCYTVTGQHGAITRDFRCDHMKVKNKNVSVYLVRDLKEKYGYSKKSL